MSNEDVAAILARAPNVLLDFDGPVCSVFSTFTPTAVAKELRRRLGLAGAPETNEPFDVLQYVASKEPSLLVEAEAELARLETEAVATARSTPGAAEVLQHLVHGGRPVVVVSNNSGAAIWTYLEQHGLTNCVAGVSARTAPDPKFLKPHPYLIESAMASLHTTCDTCVMVGDSVSDILAAKAARVSIISFANKSGKYRAFANLKPDAIIRDMHSLLPK